MTALVRRPEQDLALCDRLGEELADLTTMDAARMLVRKADVLRSCLRGATDREPEIRAGEIRLRAERRLGELMAEYRAAGLLRVGAPTGTRAGSTGSPADRITLVAAGIDERLGDRARKYALMPATEFEARLAARRRCIARGDRRVSINLLDVDKAARRAEREAELGARQAAWPTKRYGVILGDPEWQMDVWSRETGLSRAADNHYPTSTLAEICARDVAAIAADDCVLALWAIVPMLDAAFAVLDAWGFARFERDPATGHLTIDRQRARYVSSGAWTKYKPNAGIGMGRWFRVDHEILLLATRGNPPAPMPGSQARSVFDVPASRVHSQKPELVAEILESYYPTLPKIELNRRGPPRPGWDAWGQEAETAEGVAA